MKNPKMTPELKEAYLANAAAHQRSAKAHRREAAKYAGFDAEREAEHTAAAEKAERLSAVWARKAVRA